MREQSRYARIEARLRRYRSDCARLAVLEIEQADLLRGWSEDTTSKLTEPDQDRIEGQVLHPPAIGREGHATGKPSSSTERVALKEADNEVQRRADLLAHEIAHLRADIAKIDTALSAITPMERFIVQLFYFDRLSWAAIGMQYHQAYEMIMSERWLRECKRRALKTMDQALFSHTSGIVPE